MNVNSRSLYARKPSGAELSTVPTVGRGSVRTVDLGAGTLTVEARLPVGDSARMAAAVADLIPVGESGSLPVDCS